MPFADDSAIIVNAITNGVCVSVRNLEDIHSKIASQHFLGVHIDPKL